MDLKEAALLDNHEDRHWYYLSKARTLRRALEGRDAVRILDVGAGSGFFSRVLLRDTSAQSAVCVDTGYGHEWSEVINNKRIDFRRHAGVIAADVVLLMDVIEHVDDDVALLREHAEQAAAGTRFVISVPAFSWLWSGHDVFLEHRRRYTLSQAIDVVNRAGLRVTRGFYYFAGLLPAVALLRSLDRVRSQRAPRSDLRQYPTAINALLTAVCRIEDPIALHNRAFGLTAFVVAEKL